MAHARRSPLGRSSTVCVVGSVNLDRSFTVDALPRPGQTVLAAEASSAPGGKGGNQAVAAARAGASVTLVAALGDDDDATILRAHLDDNGVALDGLMTVPGPSGSAAIVVDSTGENTIVVAPGANAHLALTSPTSRAIVSAADVVLIQLEISIDAALTAARAAHAAGATVVVNASPASTDARLEQLSAVADVVVVNEEEAQQWSWPVKHLVTTLGARGATYTRGGQSTAVNAPSVESVDSTGAGDVFAGVLAAEWPSGPRRALQRACAAGALATLTPGAGDCAPTAEAIDDVVGDVLEDVSDDGTGDP